MKTSLFFIFLSTALAIGQGNMGAYLQEQQVDRNSAAAAAQESAAEAAYREQQLEQQLALERHAAEIQSTLDTFPWRIVDGVTQHVAVTWCVFSGKILEVQPTGIRVQGEFHSMYPEFAMSFNGEFFVKNYPYQAANNDFAPSFLAGLPCDVYSYTTVAGGTHTIHALNFGIPCAAPPLSPADLAKMAADRAKEADAKQAALQRVLEANEKAAAAGDPYGLLRMGERYRDGEGVATNLDMARDYLGRAALAGDLTASNELATLSAK